jgi:cytochrome c-type biogenesis protein CcmH
MMHRYSGLILAAALVLPVAAGAEQVPAGATGTAAAQGDGAAAAAQPGAPDAEVHAAPDPADLIGPPKGTPLSGAALAERTDEVAGTIRCPVCQGVSVADSPSEMAQNMKRQTQELLARGYEAEQIIHYFEQSYGEFIRLEPKSEGLKALVWILPGLLLLAGLAGIAVFVRRHRQPAAAAADASGAAELPTRDRLPDDPELVPWVKKVRELAYGWPGGEPPKGAA